MAGGISDKLNCQTLKEPETSESALYNSINSALDQTLRENLPSSDSPNNSFKIGNILNSCEEGKGLLNAFEIEVDWNESLANHGNISTNEIRGKLIDLVNRGIDDVKEYDHFQIFRAYYFQLYCAKILSHP